LANIQAQIIQFQNQVNNIVNEKRNLNKDTHNKDSQIKSIEEAVSEIRDHLVPPKPGTFRAEMEEIKNEAAKWGVDV
jgi:peptidoglycan hydrolase CwlO-like protein